MTKYIYENHLANQNETAAPDLVWVADFTTITPAFSRLHIFLCIDIHTNKVIAYKISAQTMTASSVIRTLRVALEERFPYYPAGKPDNLLLIHTDRGSQFTGLAYHNFVDEYNDLFEPSMSRHRVPRDNAVMERFVRTFKEHKIRGLTIEEYITQEKLKDPDFKTYRKAMTRYVKSINSKVNRKTNPETPLDKDRMASNASLLMVPPVYTKAFSKHFGDDPRRDHIINYKNQSNQVSSFLEEMAAVRAELVDKTPFDDPKIKKAFDLVSMQLDRLTAILQDNPREVKAIVKEILEPTEDKIEEISKDVKTLLPKSKKTREIQKLRDPIDYELFPIFLNNAGMSIERQRELKRSQLRVCYTILYYTGLRVNEISSITYQDIQDVFITSQLTVIHHKNKQSHIHTLSKRALRDLEYIRFDIETIFEKYKYKYLLGKNKPMHNKSVIRFINQDLRCICNAKHIRYNIKSHSFRIYVISSLLQQTSVQHVAQIIGHNDIRSTLMYARYALDKKEIQELFDRLPDFKIDDNE